MLETLQQAIDALQAGEVEACQTIQMVIAGGFLLYLCKSRSSNDVLVTANERTQTIIMIIVMACRNE